MLKLVIGMRASAPSHGFTLIEILVVILIVGITLSFALLAFGDFGEKRRILAAAEQFSHYVGVVEQEALLETQTFGIRITNDGYDVMRFNESGGWKSMPRTNLFRHQYFPKQLVLRITTNTKNAKGPAIIIYASGDMTDFKINFGSVKNPNMVTVIGTPHGDITVHHE